MNDVPGRAERWEEPDLARRHGSEARPRTASATLRIAPLIPEGVKEIFDRSPVATVIVDGTTQIIRYANEAFHRLHGIEVESPAELHGREVAGIFPAPMVDRVSALLHHVYDTEQPRADVPIAPGDTGDAHNDWSMTAWPLLGQTGLLHDVVMQVRVASVAAGENRQRGRIVDELREVNERLLLAALREQDLREKAQAASEAKSAFLGTMSHELRTPLNAIIGYQELLIEGISSPVTDAQRVHLERIKHSATHLLALIDQLLTLSRIETKRENVRREPVNVDALVDEAASVVAPLAEAKRLTFTTHRHRQPIALATDPLKIRHILVNLLGNAIKFTERGEVTLRVHESTNRVTFIVSDTGSGITPADLRHVFEPFWQADQTRIRVKQGSGLGLSVSRHLARLLGGDLTVESTESVGSTFTLWLPRGAFDA